MTKDVVWSGAMALAVIISALLGVILVLDAAEIRIKYVPTLTQSGATDNVSSCVRSSVRAK